MIPFAANAAGYVEEGVRAIRNGNYTAAYNILQPLALQGNPEAQFNLCGMYYQAQGLPKNDFEAARWCHAAAQNAHIEAMYNLGLMYQKGEGVGQNMNEAKKWYKEASDRGHENAGYNLAELNGTAIATATDIHHAAPMIAYNAQLAAQAAAQQLINQPVTQAVPPAPLQMAYNSPTPNNQANNPVNPNISAPVLGNNASANAAYYEQFQPASGTIQSGTIQTVKDDESPILIVDNQEPLDPITACILAAQRGKVYDICTQKKNSPQQNNYQVTSLNQVAAPKIAATPKPALSPKPHSFNLDTEGNFSTTLEAALEGKSAAQANLGIMYRKGDGVARNYPEAVKWLEKSASKGNIIAMLNLASMYQNGEGVIPNLGLAYSWYNLAADRSQDTAQKKEAMSNVQKLSRSLSNEEIGNALAFVNKLDEKIPPQI